MKNIHFLQLIKKKAQLFMENELFDSNTDF